VRTHKCLLIIGIITILTALSTQNQGLLRTNYLSSTFRSDPLNNFGNNQLSSSSPNNYDIIEEMFENKLENYSKLGYFPQVYESSLQSTYYALYILEALGKLGKIDSNEITNYIMDHYNITLEIFMDKYAYRYLDINTSQAYYAYSSILQINCYAILSLGILGNLNLIDKNNFINFIWSCYNPLTSGFVGQPYSPDLQGDLNISTMDNTYYAILTLDLLMDDWNSYLSEKDELIIYINSLQSTNTFEWYYGGFFNDGDMSFNSLKIFEPNLISAYYCVKSLDIFGMVDSININNFHQYLEGLYHSNDYYFDISYVCNPVNYSNIIGTALGLSLSDLTNFVNINSSKVVEFLLDNRNYYGLWNSSTDYIYYELIDTFQVIRALKETAELINLESNDVNQISDSLENYYQFDGGYSLISEDYTTISLLYTIINAFDLYERISDLDLQKLYRTIESAAYYQSAADCYCFSSSTKIDNDYIHFRSNPIEFYCSGNNQYLKEFNILSSHKTTFMALESLKKIYKLDDFSLKYNLTQILQKIIKSQFLEPGFSNFGAFLPFVTYTLKPPEYQNKKIFIEYTYYAVKAMELLADYLEIGTINDLNFDKNALYTYISQNIVETPLILYFKPQFTNNLEKILESTYYSIYLLKAIDMFNLNVQKIKNFISQNVNYENIKNLYYCFKISEILDLNIDFNINLSHNLIQQIYSRESHEFYLTSADKELKQDIFMWICDMAKNDQVRINSKYLNEVKLGNFFNISASLCNIILSEFGPYTIVKFESQQIGVIPLTKISNGSFEKAIFIPIDSNNFPFINGSLCVYDGSLKIAESKVSFKTTYELKINSKIINDIDDISIIINISLISGVGLQALYNSRVIAEIYNDDQFIEVRYFTSKDYLEYTAFYLGYKPEKTVKTFIKIYLDDTFQSNLTWLFDVFYFANNRDSDNPNMNIDSVKNYDREIMNAIPLIFAFLVIPSCIIVISSKSKRKTDTILKDK